MIASNDVVLARDEVIVDQQLPRAPQIHDGPLSRGKRRARQSEDRRRDPAAPPCATAVPPASVLVRSASGAPPLGKLLHVQIAHASESIASLAANNVEPGDIPDQPAYERDMTRAGTGSWKESYSPPNWKA
jgi:hypothetical protein